MTRILTLLDDILSSISSRTKVPKKNIPRIGRYLKSARCKNKEKKEESGEEGEREGEEREDMKEGGEREFKLYNTYMDATERMHSSRQNNNREEESHPTIDPVKPMTAPGPLRASTLDLLKHPAEEHLLLPKQGGEDPLFRLNTVR